VAQVFDLVGITNPVGAPSFAHSAKGGNHERVRNWVWVEETRNCIGSREVKAGQRCTSSSYRGVGDAAAARDSCGAASAGGKLRSITSGSLVCAAVCGAEPG